MKAILLVSFIFAFSAKAGAEDVYFLNDRLKLGGEILKPKGEGPFPAVLYNHGSASGMLSSQAGKAIGARFVAKGWIFFMPYRRGQGLSSNAGKYIVDEIAEAFEEGGEQIAAQKMVELMRTEQLSDQLAALRWLKSQTFVDVKRIAVAGNSFGGIQTVLGAASESYCAAVDAAGGAQSWVKAPTLRELMKESVRNSKAPIFFFQAENDFDLSPSRVLAAEMRNSNKAALLKIYPPFGKTSTEGHSFGYAASSIWFEDVFGFIQRHCAK